MTIKSINDIKAVLETIRALAAKGDHESAHGTEDELHIAVLEAIAAAKVGTARVVWAREALRSKEIAFPRHAA